MNGAVNGFSINGTVLPSWVVRAVVVAAAAATVASSEPTRTTYAAAFGDAAVSVSLSQTHTIQARATGTASVSTSIEPTLRFAGASTATAIATGNGAVRRDVFATAGGDATCTADALTAQAIGESLATAVSTVDLAQPHIIHPGRSNTLCEANGTASGDVTRYPIVLLTYGYSGPSWGEASVKRSGNSYFEHDGYGVANSSASFGIAQALTSTIITHPSYGVMQCNGQSHAFLIQPARSTGSGAGLDQPSIAQSVQSKFGVVLASGNSISAADATRIKVADAQSDSFGIQYILRPSIKYLATATADIATGHWFVTDSLRTAYTGATGSLCEAGLIESDYGVQHFSDAGAVVANTGTASALQQFISHANASALCVAAKPIHGTQHRAAAEDGCISTASMPNGLMNHASSAEGDALAALIQSPFGTQHRAAAEDFSISSSDRVPSSVLRQGHVSDILATALVGKALALANSEIRAPDDRYMIVAQEERDMIVFAEERLMVVTA